jgi:hypothetical protein
MNIRTSFVSTNSLRYEMRRKSLRWFQLLQNHSVMQVPKWMGYRHIGSKRSTIKAMVAIPNSSKARPTTSLKIRWLQYSARTNHLEPDWSNDSTSSGTKHVSPNDHSFAFYQRFHNAKSCEKHLPVKSPSVWVLWVKFKSWGWGCWLPSLIDSWKLWLFLLWSIVSAGSLSRPSVESDGYEDKFPSSETKKVSLPTVYSMFIPELWLSIMKSSIISVTSPAKLQIESEDRCISWYYFV